MQMGFKDTLAEFEKQISITHEAVKQTPWENEKFYVPWLAQTNYYVSHSTRLLALCAAQISPADPVGRQLHTRFLQHAAEEKGHENLVLLDLKHLGHKLEETPEFPSTSSLYQVQYYWIEHVNPLAFFGYIMCLEGQAAACGPEGYGRTLPAYGPKGTHFLRVHATEDVDHTAKARALLETFDEATHKVIVPNMIQSFENYRTMMANCVEYAQRSKGKKAA
jgi:hypothetical protein